MRRRTWSPSRFRAFVPLTTRCREAATPFSVLVWTWPGDQKTAEELAARWRDHGALLYDSPWTEPMSLKIPSQPEPENCEAGITEEAAIAIAERRLKESGSSLDDYNVLAEDQGVEATNQDQRAA